MTSTKDQAGKPVRVHPIWDDNALHRLLGAFRLGQGGAERYWENRYRDEAAENDRLRQQRDEAYERAALACEKLQQDFLSEEYAIPQPAGSISERFACGRCAEKIRRLASGQGGSEVEK